MHSPRCGLYNTHFHRATSGKGYSFCECAPQSGFRRRPRCSRTFTKMRALSSARGSQTLRRAVKDSTPKARGALLVSATLEVTPLRLSGARRGLVARRQLAVTCPVSVYVRGLVRLRHAAVGVAPVEGALGDTGVLGEVLTDAVRYVLSRLTYVDDLLCVVGEFVHAGQRVAPTRRG